MKEGSRDGRRLFSKQDVEWVGRRKAQRVVSACFVRAALAVGTISKAIMVIVDAVVASLLHRYAAVRTIPAIVASALPVSVRHDAVPVAATAMCTALEGAMTSIPALNAEAGPILALPMFYAADVAKLLVALGTGPALDADAFASLTSPVRATVQVTLLLGAIRSRPLVIADTPLEVQVKLAMPRAIWQAAEGVAVRLAAVIALPALPAQAHATDANSVTRTVGVQAVDFFTV